MKWLRQVVMVLVCVSGGVAPAGAGWVVEWQSTATRSTGERMPPETATMHISAGRVRLAQPQSITVLDYNESQFTVMHPGQQFFWSGPLDDYLREMAQNRKENMRGRAGEKRAKSYGLAAIDESKLPRIVIKQTGTAQTIAGHATTPYRIESNGELFQELWLAEGLNLGGDLDPKKFLAYQRKLSGGMLGKSSGPYNALYRSEDYLKLTEKGFALRTVVHHGAGSFERLVTAIRKADIDPKEFAVPATFRRVRLADVFPKEEPSGAPSR
jgi:hypothetical protein